MAFPRALLLFALLGSAAFVRAAPTGSSCEVHLHQWGAINFNGSPLARGSDGDVVIGGNPINFANAVCSQQSFGKYEKQSKGYLVDANDPTQCLTVSNLDQANATFGFQDCRFNGAGDVWASQSFAWDFDDNGASQNANGWFNGENPNYVNGSQYGIYSLRAERSKPDIDGRLGKLFVDYTPELTAPSTPLAIPMNNVPVTAPAQQPTLNCDSVQTGTMRFSNTTSASNQYDGPLNAKWEADSSTSDQFIFERCDYSPVGIDSTDSTVYGRIRPGSDATDSGFNCYTMTDPYNDDSTHNEPVEPAWINGFQTDTCTYSIPDYPRDIWKLDTTSNEIVYVPFGNKSQPGVLAAYTQLDYDREYDVTQYVWDPNGIGFAYLSADNANLTKYPPGQVTFHASS
ncbi:hypothetical protein PSEUBRA_001626 [Kalmanozyma brasiliensis GHG001]|uniref:Ricin B lectin domain-containing protein n=1 Tax=Kalmanozyma brasiliensis (strain GHG001) TaxID=1365824 RepID=V5F0W5_KALBG|nr:uncharacterized protein PSEUBRA_001626 [Kalmanozyma brasiliensis GHG001]EST08904.1 hypothetical protein PSEUBRA_001626 [Kalmanozyma brasiliensis GHG001]